MPPPQQQLGRSWLGGQVAISSCERNPWGSEGVHAMYAPGTLSNHPYRHSCDPPTTITITSWSHSVACLCNAWCPAPCCCCCRCCCNNVALPLGGCGCDWQSIVCGVPFRMHLPFVLVCVVLWSVHTVVTAQYCPFASVVSFELLQ